MTVSVSKSPPRKWIVLPKAEGAAANSASNSTVPNTAKQAKMPSAKPKSPTRLTTKALMAAAEAVGFLYQKPMSR